MFVSCKGHKKVVQVGRQTFCIIFCLKCVFYAYFMLIGSLKGKKTLKVGICWSKKVIRVGLQQTNNFF